MTKYQKQFQKLATMLAKAEGKKVQVRIGDIREILRILIEISAEHSHANMHEMTDDHLNADPIVQLLELANNRCAQLRKKKGK